MEKKDDKLKYFPIALAAVIFIVMGFIISKEYSTIFARKSDDPPEIEFTWTPLGRADLLDIRGHLRITDDYSLDFTTYEMRIAELDRSFDLPVEGLVGREYEQDISFSILAGNYDLLRRGEMTVEFTISDDVGQSSAVTKVIKIKQSDLIPDLELIVP